MESVYGNTDVIQFTVAGADPWLGTPVATLLDEDGQPVLFDNQTPMVSDTMAWWIELNEVPSYREAPELDERRFEWQLSIPAQRAVFGVAPSLAGLFRIQVELPTSEGVEVVTSDLFEIAP